jgi:20S proteasome alpha/beta subunit
MTPRPDAFGSDHSHPAFWRIGHMTVCIAAFAARGEHIVMASDQRVAFGDFSAEASVQKNYPLKNRYAVMIAGNDVDYALPTISRVRNRMNPDTRDPDEIAEMLHDELVETRRKKIEAKVLSKLGFTSASFLSEGKNSLTDSAFYELVSRIDREELSLTFLLAGFDDTKEPHLRIVSADDVPQDRDALGFAAIGSGALAATASLAFDVEHSAFHATNNLIEVTYHVLAAKFMAESATDVGKSTFYVAANADDGSNFLSSHVDIDAVRQSWLKHGSQRFSRKTAEVISDLLYKGGEEDEDDVEHLSKVIKYATTEGERTYIQSLIDKARGKS